MLKGWGGRGVRHSSETASPALSVRAGTSTELVRKLPGAPGTRPALADTCAERIVGARWSVAVSKSRDGSVARVRSVTVTFARLCRLAGPTYPNQAAPMDLN